MTLKNEIFAHVLDWLVREKMVKDQQDLSKKTGISKNTISRIMTGKVDPKDDTLRKLNGSFGNIFNMAYLRGQSTIMLIADLEHENSKLSEDDSLPYSPIPRWADSLITILSEQIKKNEALNRELRQSIQEVDALRTDLQELIKKKSLKNPNVSQRITQK